MRKILLLSALIALTALGSGCKSLVYFRSEPPGAKLYINGLLHGETPCSVQLKWNTFTKFDVKLEKDGFHPLATKLQKELKWGYIVLDAIFLWPLAFFNAAGPKDSYDFYLTSLSEPNPMQPPEPAPSEPADKRPEPAPLEPGRIQVFEDVKDRPRMACLEFRKGNEDAASVTTTIQEMFCTGFVESKRFSIIEREQIEKIFKEKQFARTGEVDAQTAKQLGKILGVDYLLIGSVSKLGETFEIDARLLDVNTGQTETASDGSCSSASHLRSTIYGIVNDLNRKFSDQ